VAIGYLSDLAGCNPENDNLDVHLTLDDGREFTLTVAMPNNIFWCMENEGNDCFFCGAHGLCEEPHKREY
jgi:hypothetical protein